MDSWDPKPERPYMNRGPFGVTQTKLPGVQICEHLPLLARLADKCTIIRSLVGAEDRHDAVTCLTGRHPRNSPPGGWPCLGSVVSRLQGPVSRTVPPFVGLSPKMGHTPWSDNGAPGFLGIGHAPFQPNKGGGNWGNRVVMTGDVDLGVIPIEDVHVRDINGDGLADIVAVGYNYVSYWINRGNNTWSPEFRKDNTPVYIRGQTVLQQADINGNGSTDFLWENFNPATGNYDVDYVDFLGATKPNLLATIDNGIGLRTEIAYQPTTTYYLADLAAGVPWHTRLPFPSDRKSVV